MPLANSSTSFIVPMATGRGIWINIGGSKGSVTRVTFSNGIATMICTVGEHLTGNVRHG